METKTNFKHWVDLSEDNIRALLIALIGLDFGHEPEKRIPEIKESRKAFANHIADQCRVTADDSVVDLGSGCGFGTYWLARRAKHVHACDISPAYLSFAARECAALGNISYHHIESRSLDGIADTSIDVVCSMSVFIHLNLYDIYWYFAEFARILRPGGRIWIDVADPESLDLKTPNTQGGYFLAHAKDYKRRPDSLPGLMQWNSARSAVLIASHFGFDVLTSREDGQITFIRS